MGLADTYIKAVQTGFRKQFSVASGINDVTRRLIAIANGDKVDAETRQELLAEVSRLQQLIHELADTSSETNSAVARALASSRS